MTALRPSLLKLVTPAVVFLCVLGALALVNRSPSHERAESRGAGADLSTTRSGSTDQQIAALQRAVRAEPGRAEGYARLGDAYLQKARRTGDPSLYSRAQGSFDAALRRDARNLAALVGAGTLANTRHKFRDALRRGLEARRVAPDLAAPYTVIADAQLELGRYAQAERTIQRMVDLKPTLASYARASYLRELTGNLHGAAEAMRLAVSAGSGAPENVAYVDTLLGDLELARGRQAAASDAYRRALAAQPSYARGLAGLGRVDTARGRLGAAARRLRQATDRLPLTSYLTLLAEVQLAAGREAPGRHELRVVRAQQRLFSAAGTAPDAELVLFEADHGDRRRAVRLGREVWRAAPSVRSADALGWALTRAGRPRAGLRWARKALRLGSVDPLFHFHAGISAAATRRPGLAGRELRAALARAAALPPLAAQAARRALGGLR
jgi:tetratricopeptide (TPR) repeat protein